MSLPDSIRSNKDIFDTTHWSLVLAAGLKSPAEARAALETLCNAYWTPVYVYVRRRSRTTEDAQDQTQGFFAHLLEPNRIGAADPARGRFRAFLLSALKNYLSHEWERANAQKRGGGRCVLSLDLPSGELRFVAVDTDQLTPERLFEREWALALLDRAVNRLQEEYRAQGKNEVFELLKGSITADDSRPPYAEVAARLGTSENAVQVAAHRLRNQYRTILRDEIAQTVDDPREIDDEIHQLMAALSVK